MIAYLFAYHALGFTAAGTILVGQYIGRPALGILPAMLLAGMHMIFVAVIIAEVSDGE